MLSTIDSRTISHFVYLVDRICRADLNKGVIISERDFISSFTTHLRYPYGPFLRAKGIFSATLSQRQESLIGCDFIIIFKKGNNAKILLLEAKLLRPSRSNHKWDSPKKKSSTYLNWSRFTSQLYRQNQFIGSGAIIGELIINDIAPQQSSNPFDNFGSNFIFHHDAFNYANQMPHRSTLWQTSDIIKLLPQSNNLNKLIYDILRCNQGDLLEINNNSITLRKTESEDSTNVPIFNSLDNIKRISSFLTENNINNYLCINLDEIFDNL